MKTWDTMRPVMRVKKPALLSIFIGAWWIKHIATSELQATRSPGKLARQATRMSSE